MNGKEWVLENMVGTVDLLQIDSDVSQDLRLQLLESLYVIKEEFREKREKGLLKNPNERCGAIVVLGYDSKYDACVYPMHRDLVEEDGLEYHLDNSDSTKKLLMGAATSTDGAVLIDSKGNIMGTGFYLNGFSLKDVVKCMGLKMDHNLSKTFKFCEEVGTRHINAKAASYIMPNTLVYTLSEESDTPKIRVFYNGDMVASTYKKEVTNTFDLAA